jgi:fructose-1,6-bisphosphatase/sedoheptulose 1,7-bisphosphatase-like protein
MKHALLAEDLDGAMEFAYNTTKTDKVIIFDGATGGVNVSRSLADHLKKVAPALNEQVDTALMPKWLEQRNLNAELLEKVV